MDVLSTAYIEFEQYPQNIPNQNTPLRKLRGYTSLLDHHAERLFTNDACLVFWDLYRDAHKFEQVQAKSLEAVRQKCLLGCSQEFNDRFRIIDCRFIFLYSTNTRSPLFSTRDMLMLALSYHTVDAWFLDFMFPFGEQDEPQDFRYSCFRHKLYDTASPNLEVPRLDRTGHELHLCYNLRAVETTRSKQMPWSVRQAVLYQSFDFDSGQAIFIIIKGNDFLNKELTRETCEYQWTAKDRNSKILNSFSSSLKTLLSFCWWSCDGWRPYINYLESKMNDLTKQVISEEVKRRPAPIKPFKVDKLRRRPTFSLPRQFTKNFDSKNTHSVATHEIGATRTSTWSTGKETLDPEPSYQELEFPDLQRAQYVEEQANEALHALVSNIKIINLLSQFYTHLPNISNTMSEEASQFCCQLTTVVSELEMYQSSLETLLKLFRERKNLLLSILEFQSMQSSKYFAEKAQISSDIMQRMTEEMRHLTQQTKDETVSMTAIALVTMFFLPGTFVSALMSTDIVKWSVKPDGEFELKAAPGARNLFLVLTLPLMFVTFGIWLFVNLQRRRSDKRLPAVES